MSDISRIYWYCNILNSIDVLAMDAIELNMSKILDDIGRGKTPPF